MSDSDNSNDPLNRPFRGFSQDATRRATDRIHGNPDSSDEYEANDGEEEEQEAQEGYDTNDGEEEEHAGDVEESEDRPEQSEEVIAGIAKVRAAFGGRGLFARTASGEPLVLNEENQTPPAETSPSVKREPAGLEKDATVKAEMDVAKEMYLTQLESGEKWGETHNVLRKKYTETLGTYIETQRLLAETEARIRFGNRERERDVGEKDVIQNPERFDEFLEGDEEYQNKIAELTRLLERAEVEFREKDSSFDPAAALLGDSKLIMSFESYLEASDGPIKPVFESMQKPVLSYEEEQMVGEELVLKFYLARTEYLTSYHAFQMGHASRDFFRQQEIKYKRLREDVTNTLMRQGHAIDIYQEDPAMLKQIKQYWLSGFKKGRVAKTGEKVGKQKKGTIGRTVAAVLAFFAAWSHDPNAPQEPSVRYEDTRGQAPDSRRTPQRLDASQETASQHVFETPFVQEVPEGRGAISTFRMLLSRMTPQMREAIYQGIEQSTHGGMTEEDHRLLRSVRANPDRYADGAQLLARQLGFAKADATTEPQIPSGSQFVFDREGFHVEHEGRRTQLLNAQFEVVATYGSE